MRLTEDEFLEIELFRRHGLTLKKTAKIWNVEISWLRRVLTDRAVCMSGRDR